MQFGEIEQSSPATADLSAAAVSELCEWIYVQIPLGKLCFTILEDFSLRMANQLSFTGFAWKNLWCRRLRTLLTLGGIAMAIGAFVALMGFSRAFEHEWLRMYARHRHRHRGGGSAP